MAEQTHAALIAEVRNAILKTTSGAKQKRLLARLDEMDAAPTSALGVHIKELSNEIEEDAAEIAPFLSRLSSLLP